MLILTLERSGVKVPITIEERDITPSTDWKHLFELMHTTLKEREGSVLPSTHGTTD